MPYCRECGGEIPEASNFCEHCGAELQSAGGAAGPGDGQRRDVDDAGRAGEDTDRGDDLWGDDDGPIDPGTPGSGNDESNHGRGQSTGAGHQPAGGGHQPAGDGHPSAGDEHQSAGGGQHPPGGGHRATGGGHQVGGGHQTAGGAHQAGAGHQPGGGHPTPGGNRTQNYSQYAGQTPPGQPGGQPPAGAVDDPPRTNPAGPSPFDEGAVTFGFDFPTRESIVPVLLGGILALIPIVSLITQGFALQLTRAAGRGQSTPPDFDGLGALFVDGLKFLALMIVWYVVVIVAFFVVGFLGALAGGPIGFLVGAVLVLGLIYALPAMITVLAVTDDFGAAFSGEYVLAWLGTGHYLVALLLSLVVWFLLGILMFFSLITIVGIIFVAAWATFVVAAFWGYKYREAVERGILPPAPAEPV